MLAGPPVEAEKKVTLDMVTAMVPPSIAWKPLLSSVAWPTWKEGILVAFWKARR